MCGWSLSVRRWGVDSVLGSPPPCRGIFFGNLIYISKYRSAHVTKDYGAFLCRDRMEYSKISIKKAEKHVVNFKR